MVKIIITTLVIICLMSRGLAQPYVDLFSINYQFSPQTKVDSTNTKPDITDLNISLTLPIPIKQHAFITGVGFNSLSFRPDVDSLNWDQAYELRIPLGLKWQHTDKFSGLYMALPRIRSNLQRSSDRSYQLGGVLLFSKQVSDKVKYKYGLYYNGELFSPFFVPLVGLYWTPNDKWELTSTLPQYAYLYYRLHRTMQVGLGFRSSVGSFLIQNDQPAYLHKSTNELMLMYNISIKKSLIIQFRAGHSIGRYYRLYDSSDRNDVTISAFRVGDERSQINNELNDGLLFQVDFIYRYFLSSK